MDNNSIEKRQVGALHYNDEVVVDCNPDELSNYLDKHEGGEVSGAVGIVQHDIEILSGNYIQTSMPDSITNYVSKNAIIQADVDPHYGDSYAGTKAFCVLGLSSATNQIKLSGDI